MKPQISALRAITSRYAFVVLRPLIVIAAGVIVLLVALIGYLAYAVSLWWLVFLLPLTLVATVISAIAAAALFIALSLAPPMTKQQKRTTNAYVRNIFEVSDGLQTPQFIIVYRIIRDVLQRKDEDSFLYGLAVNSVRLKKDFDALAQLFSDV